MCREQTEEDVIENRVGGVAQVMAELQPMRGIPHCLPSWLDLIYCQKWDNGPPW